ncbi:WLM domain-containing protein [Apodospora peruviana]|uniref:WLM domain-containing protein n=1 Tax=Apodospora peruviana TaxID=516989 RepID=A0AAE0IQW9_9PEZI|nr:WLM domain-containing protein [Apodospora peruviana]
MPIGIQRLNAKKSQPNDRIVFIKPLKGPDEAIAQDFLERISAQCLPIMREHRLSVMSLEEYEPNAEFVGRNFNAGEVIQLVLKARSTGHWLPFNYVQMVMMHELAHCKQMNHSRAFWAARNEYAEQMRALWVRGFSGEGLWGRGALLATGEFERNSVQPGEVLPEHLCGGTYRSRGRKREAKKVLTYQEQKERRILKKFGANGVALGEDVAVKRRLEKGRTVSAKPRVAKSTRGRELRAAAALARFHKSKKEQAEVKDEEKVKVEDDEETASGSETESGEDYDDGGVGGAVDINGKRLLDAKGKGMIKVCENENPEDQDAQQELLELQGFGSSGSGRPRYGLGGIKLEEDEQPSPAVSDRNNKTLTANTNVSENDLSAGVGISKVKRESNNSKTKCDPPPATKPPDSGIINMDLPRRSSNWSQQRQQQENSPLVSLPTPTAKTKATLSKTETKDLIYRPPVTPRPEPKDREPCSVCSFANKAGELVTTCAMCGNVFDPDKLPGSWACTTQACRGSKYTNPGDAAVCGVCGERRDARL